jgi:hypothetical protein
MTYRRTIFGLLFTALVVSGAAARGQDLEPTTVRGGVSIQLPKGWVANDAGAGASGGKSILTAAAPQNDKDSTGEYQAVLTITPNAGGKVDAAAIQERLGKDPALGYKAVEPPTTVTVNGLAGVYFGGTSTRGALKLRSRQYNFTRGNQVYIINFVCLNSRWGAYQGALEASVATFAVTAGK